MILKKGINGRARKVISLIISFVLLISIITNILFINNNENIAQAASPTPSSTINGKVNNSKQPQPHPKTHEYTLIAQDTTVEIAPGIRVDAWTYNVYSRSYFNSDRGR